MHPPSKLQVFKCSKRYLLYGQAAMAGFQDFLWIFVTSFLLNMIPFAGPSNLFIASNAALIVKADPFSIGFVVALGSAIAKFIHYIVTFFVGLFVSGKRRKQLDAISLRVRKWAPLALFAVAATPLPDEPVVIPLGLMKYNPAKFFIAYFFGKLLITVIGAYIGLLGGSALTPFVSEEVLIVISVVLTVLLTIVLLKVDLVKIAEKILKRKLDWLPSSQTTDRKHLGMQHD